MRKGLFLFCLLSNSLFGQPAEPSAPPHESLGASRCHVFIDYQVIWTLEMLGGEGGAIVPVVNIVTFAKGQWDLRPEQIHLFADRRREAEIEQFSIDTGVAGEPYLVQYLKVLGESFIGMDLMGNFRGFEELSQAYIDLDNTRFTLEAVDCLDFETLADKVNQINFDSPDLRQDFSVLNITPHGKREARRRHY